MIVGNDISHYQGNIDWATYAKNTNFVILEVSEGVSFTDPLFAQNRAQARAYNLPIAYYHFTRPDAGNAPQNEADYFLKQIGVLMEGEVLCIDFEVNFNEPVAWLKDFLDHILEKTGVHALIYLNKSEIQQFDWTPIAEAGYGLWLADYIDQPILGAWKLLAIQQWTNKQTVPGISSLVDGDRFFGTAEQFKMYGYHQISPPGISPSASLSPSASVSQSASPSSSIPKSLIEMINTIDDQWNWFGAKGWYRQLAKLRQILNG
jgi:GH25 family lysozyme M1 (1,4-beta-N-acetylmuramidase)